MIIALLAVAVLFGMVLGGVRMFLHNPELEHRVKALQAERDRLGALTSDLYQWAQEGIDDPQRRVVYDTIRKYVGTQVLSEIVKGRKL